MKKAREPLNAGKVAELTGLDWEAVDKAFAEMKKDGTIVSPVRYKWEPEKKCPGDGRCPSHGRCLQCPQIPLIKTINREFGTL